MTPPFLIRGTLREDDLLPVARYVWNRSAGLKIGVGTGGLLILIGIGCLLVALRTLAIGEIVFGSFVVGYQFFLPGLQVTKQFKTARQVSEEGAYEFDEVQFRISRPYERSIRHLHK